MGSYCHTYNSFVSYISDYCPASFRLSKTSYILVILLLIISTRSCAQADFIIDSVSVYNERLTPVEVASRIDVLSLNFNKLPDNRINFGLVDNDFLLVILKISTPSLDQHFTLSIDNTSLNSVTIPQIRNRMLIFKIYLTQLNEVLA